MESIPVAQPGAEALPVAEGAATTPSKTPTPTKKVVKKVVKKSVSPADKADASPPGSNSTTSGAAAVGAAAAGAAAGASVANVAGTKVDAAPEEAASDATPSKTAGAAESEVQSDVSRPEPDSSASRPAEPGKAREAGTSHPTDEARDEKESEHAGSAAGRRDVDDADYEDEDDDDVGNRGGIGIPWGGWGTWAQTAMKQVATLKEAVTEVASGAAQELGKTVKATAAVVHNTVSDTLIDLAKDVEFNNHEADGNRKRQQANETDDSWDKWEGEEGGDDDVESKRKLAPKRDGGEDEDDDHDKEDDEDYEQGRKSGSMHFDSAMENMASTALSALGTALQGGINFVTRVEKSAVEIAKRAQIQEVQKRGTAALEAVGRRAMGILAPLPRHGDGFGGPLGKMSGPLGAPGKDDLTFERHLFLLGGQGHIEEIESFANEASLKCMKARSKMDPPGRGAFDQLILEVRDLLAIGAGPDNFKGLEGTTDEDIVAFASLARAACTFAKDMAADCLSGDMAKESEEASADVEEAVADALKAVEGLRAEGVQRLAQLCALCLDHVVQLGHGIQTFDDGKTARFHGLHMLQSVEALAGGVTEGLKDIPSVFGELLSELVGKAPEGGSKEAEGGEGEGAESEAVDEVLVKGSVARVKAASMAAVDDFKSDAEAAAGHVKSSLQQLLYPLLVTRLPAPQASGSDAQGDERTGEEEVQSKAGQEAVESSGAAEANQDKAETGK